LAKIEIKNLTKKFGEAILAVKNISLTIEDGQFFCLLGPSGCGKSTTLRMLAGLEEISEGEIWLDNELINHIPPKNRNMSMVFEGFALYPHLSVYDNIAFPLRIRNLPAKEVDERVRSVLKIINLQPFANRKPNQLSDGQKQRVSLGRAIVRQPRVYLFDEPISHLEAKLRELLREEIASLQRKLGVTTVYVTHDQYEALTMADKIAVMDNGDIKQVGSPKDLYSRPANVFVAGFVGEFPMNLLKGSIQTEGDKIRLVGPALSLSLDQKTLAQLEKKDCKGEVIVGIRPEHLAVREHQIDHNYICAQVMAVEPYGDCSVIFAETQNDVVQAITEFETQVKQKSICFELDPAKVHFFNSKSGKSVEEEHG
jgi:multiple sugar transport system ATP-binding protein